LTVHKRLIIL